MAKATPTPKKKKTLVKRFQRFVGEQGPTDHDAWLASIQEELGSGKIKIGDYKHLAGETVVEYTDSDFPPDEEPTQLPA